VKPIINLDDPVGKTVGRRVAPADALEYAFGLQAAVNQFAAPRRATGKLRGVFRFRSHEEADQWMMNHYCRKGN